LRENLTSSSDGEGLETGGVVLPHRASPLPDRRLFASSNRAITWKIFAFCAING